MNTEEAATVLQIASTLDESEDKNLMTVATILRGMLGEIQRLGTESDKLRADLAARDAEIADLKRGGVVSARDLDGLWQIVEREREWRLQDLECKKGEIRESVGRLRREWDEATSSLRTTPADRELMRLVDELIRWHGLRPLDKRPDHAAALVGAIKSLRAKPTQEPAP